VKSTKAANFTASCASWQELLSGQNSTGCSLEKSSDRPKFSLRWRDVTNCQRGSRGARRSAATARRAARPEREAHQGTSMPIQVTAFASLLLPAMTSKTQSRPCAIVRDAASLFIALLFFGPNRAPTGASVSRGAGSTRARRAPVWLADESAGLARSHAAGRPRSADTPREGWRHMPRLLSNAPGTLVFSFSTIAAGRARRRDAPWTAGARLARRRRVPRASRAIPRPLPSSTPRR
jgi:hypothetical protein